ncbi:MAG: hypothetical protein ACQERB_16945 [Promethearchaeati archaeon]
MRNFNISYIIGLFLLVADMILCFIMIYLGHLDYWQFIDDTFAVYFFISIISIFGVGAVFIIVGYARRNLEGTLR